ncbi:thermonuclease family protein [Leptolyngbya sp. 15MV]|nr:thermonuclease family protein [Leptolyngbya sp. 15MV]
MTPMPPRVMTAPASASVAWTRVLVRRGAEGRGGAGVLVMAARAQDDEHPCTGWRIWSWLRLADAKGVDRGPAPAGAAPRRTDRSELRVGRAALTGHAVVTDGDTISLNGQRIRLEGVDAPEAAQRCEREGVPWPCGADATFALQLFLQGRVLRCTDNGRDRYQRILARCWVGEQDLGAWLVREGWAVAYTEYSWRYLPEELAARWDGRGLWAGRFERPADWRRRNAR